MLSFSDFSSKQQKPLFLQHPKPDFGDINNLEFGDLDPEGNHIVSTRIRVARSVEGYSFPPCLKNEVTFFLCDDFAEFLLSDILLLLVLFPRSRGGRQIMSRKMSPVMADKPTWADCVLVGILFCVQHDNTFSLSGVTGTPGTGEEAEESIRWLHWGIQGRVLPSDWYVKGDPAKTRRRPLPIQRS